MMMNFACVQDCSRCPFACNRQPVFSQKTELPKAIVQNLSVPESKIPVQDTELKPNFSSESIQKAEETTLPAVQELQYTVEDDVSRKKLFNWRKNK